ncbi:MAG: type II toxin-antitoxin system RelE/ParE family toxin [Ignavibacteria bacterium]|nr:type II toxin-antitoxin system RelE/ParE family toxin [Ignavibacteria bacterium]
MKDKKILNLVADCIEITQKASNKNEILHLKKLQGHNTYYRIKIKDYRIGVIIEKTKIEFVRILHRKEIYRYFPK